MNHQVPMLIAACCIWCTCANAQSSPATCAVDPPVSAPAGEVELRSFAAANSSTWSVTKGRIQGNGTAVTWILPTSTGRFTATLKSGDVHQCTVSVFVEGNDRSEKRETGSIALLRGLAEPAGYGMYSYFLLGATPDERTRERALKAIDAYLRLTPSLVALEGLFDRPELNANMIPVTEAPPQSPTARWLLDHYDYARARSVIARIDPNFREGPYLLSLLAPVGLHERIGGPTLIQDLSNVPPHLVSDWYRYFLDQTTQERFWEERKLQAIGMRMRTIVGVLALGLPEVKGSLQEWVKWSN